MEKKTEITKIVIEIEGEKISVSKEGAEKLYKVLDELFGKSPIISDPIVIDRYPYRPWYWTSVGTGYTGNGYVVPLQ
jgi:hypothetical protein